MHSGNSTKGSAMDQPDVERAIAYALERLEHELPAALSYHSVAHTRDEVVPAVERLAMTEGVADDALVLLRTAAWYHDLGFVEQRIDHEAISVRIASMALPRFSYSPPQIAAIGGMIMVTKLPQEPYTLLEALLADADLDLLGRADFFGRNQDLRDELAAFGMHVSDAQWYSDQLRFFQEHHYWTAAARALRNRQKQLNMEALAQLLARCKTARV
jgi:uncharacterized protein